MTEFEEQSLAVWGRIADSLEIIAAAVMVDEDAPPACEHPEEKRVDFGGMGATEPNWECRACGFQTQARRAELAPEAV